MLTNHTCNNPEHRRETMLAKIVLTLLIVVIFNTFTSVFILFTLYASRISEPTDILRPGTYLKHQTSDNAPEINNLSMGKVEELTYLPDDFEEVENSTLESSLNLEFLNDVDIFLETIEEKLDTSL